MNAYIIKGFRSAVGKAKKGGFRNYRSDDLAVDIVSYLASQVPQLDPKEIDDVIVGCANPEGEQGLQVGRLIAARALGKEVPGMTINRYCGSGLEAIAIAAAKINAGMGHCYIAGGAESMSLLPMTGYKLVPSYNAEKYNITREQADEFSVRSHALAGAAIRDGKFRDEIVPVTVKEVYVENNKRVEKEFVIDTDEGVRADTSLAEKSCSKKKDKQRKCKIRK